MEKLLLWVLQNCPVVDHDGATMPITRGWNIFCVPHEEWESNTGCHRLFISGKPFLITKSKSFFCFKHSGLSFFSGSWRGAGEVPPALRKRYLEPEELPKAVFFFRQHIVAWKVSSGVNSIKFGKFTQVPSLSALERMRAKIIAYQL